MKKDRNFGPNPCLNRLKAGGKPAGAEKKEPDPELEAGSTGRKS